MSKTFKKTVYMILSFILLVSVFAFSIGDRPVHASEMTFDEAWATAPTIENAGVNLPSSMVKEAFVDLFMYSRPFRALDSNDLVPLDGNGWPTTDVRAILFDSRPTPQVPPFDDPDAANRLPDISGTYHLSFKGQADIAPNTGSSTSWTIANKHYNSVTNTTTADFVIPPFTGDYLDFLVVINFSNTKRTANAAVNTGISEIKLLKPGYDATQTFTNEFLNSLKPFSTIRFYEWNLGLGYLSYCGSAVVNKACEPYLIDWADRRSPTTTQYKFEKDNAQSQVAWEDSVAWEYIVELANLTGKDPWINIPPQASDDYIAGLAAFLHTNLNPGIRIYLEYSNEVWGGLASPRAHNRDAACMEVTGQLCYAGSSTRLASNLNVPEHFEPDIWSNRLYARKTWEIADIFLNEFGAGSLNTVIRPILGGQHVVPTRFNNSLIWLKDNYGDPSNYLYGLATGIYMKCPAGAVNKDDPAQYDACFRSDYASKSVSVISQVRAVADNYKLAYVAYEGGTSNGGGTTANIDARIAAERLPSMTNLIKDFLNTWSKGGGELFMYYNLYAQPSRYGSWGLIEDLNKVETPKTRAILELGADAAVAPTNFAVNIGASGIDLTWNGDVISGVGQPYKYVTYSVLRSESAAGPFKLLRRGITTTSYTDTDSSLDFDTPYYYKVTAVNFGGSADSIVKSSLESSANPGLLLAYEPFDYSANTNLIGLNGGNGWNGGWNGTSDFTISNGNPLVYPGLTHSGNHLINSSTTVKAEVNRNFDLTSNGAFSEYLVDSKDAIGKPGTTLWSSVVIRSEGTENQFQFRPWVGAGNQSKVEIGYLGTKVSGNQVWEAKFNYNEKRVASTVPIIDGAPTLIVTKMEFESANNTNVKIYINPDLSSGVEPAVPDIASFFTPYGKITKATIYVMKNAASIDEIRYGSSFANVTVIPDPETAPVFTTQPQGSDVSLGDTVSISAEAQGSPAVTYQWFKDATEIPGATNKNLTIKNFAGTNAGSYTVKATNAVGTIESNQAVLTLGAFTGFKIARTSQAPVIGAFNNTVWANAQSYALDQKVLIEGGLDVVEPTDHSASAKALWDNDYLYLLYDITDNVLIKHDAGANKRDDVELFLDRNNSKNTTYGPGDFQFAFAYDDTVPVSETKHNATTGISYQSQDRSGGYLLEARIPWTTIGITPSEGGLMGWDLASDDTDGYGLQSKIAWHTTNDDIWQYPDLMGVAMLTGGTPDVILVDDDFEDGNADGWTKQAEAGGPLDSGWSVVMDGSYQLQDENNKTSESFAVTGVSSWTNYSIEADVTPLVNNGPFYLVGRLAHDGPGGIGGHLVSYQFGYNNTRWQIDKHAGTWSTIGYSSTMSITANQTYHLKAVLDGDQLSFYVDGVLVASTTDSTLTNGRVGFVTNNYSGKTGTKVEFDNFKVVELP